MNRRFSLNPGSRSSLAGLGWGGKMSAHGQACPSTRQISATRDESRSEFTILNLAFRIPLCNPMTSPAARSTDKSQSMAPSARRLQALTFCENGMPSADIPQIRTLSSCATRPRFGCDVHAIVPEDRYVRSHVSRVVLRSQAAGVR